MRSAFLLALAFLALGACAHRSGYPGPTAHMGWEPRPYAETLAPPDEAGAGEGVPPSDATGGGARVARAAGRMVGRSHLVVDGEKYRWDCSGLVMAAYAAAGQDLSGSSADMFEYAREHGVVHRRKRPRPGDVAFFDDTYDRDGNGRRDDELTHVGVVEAVAADGTVTLVHLGSKGVVRISMNLRSPHEHVDERERVVNDHLRAARDADGGPTLTSELWRAFGSLWAADDHVAEEAEPTADDGA